MRPSVPLILSSFKLFTLANLSSSAKAFAPAASRISFLPSSVTVPLSSSSSSSLVATIMKSTTDAAAVEVKVGDTLPDVTVTELVTGADKPVEVKLADLIKGKKVAIFGVPGAFTPGCSKSHLPSFMTAQDELKAKGVEETFCLATNDAFVMEAWGRTSGGSDAGIRFLSDGSGELIKALGLTMDTPTMLRTKRFSLVADNGVVTHYFSSAVQSSDTWAPNVVSAL